MDVNRTDAIAQPGTADIPAFPQTICQHNAEFELNDTVFQPNPVYEPSSPQFLKRWLLTSSNFCGALHDESFCCCDSMSQSQTTLPFVHLFLIDTEQKNIAMAIINCNEKFKNPTVCSWNMNFGRVCSQIITRNRIVGRDQTQTGLWTQLPYLNKLQVLLHFGFSKHPVQTGHENNNFIVLRWYYFSQGV